MSGITITFNNSQQTEKKIVQAWLKHLKYKTGKTYPRIMREALQDYNLKHDERGNLA